MKALIILIYIALITSATSLENENIFKIVLKIDDELITNQDVIKESKILKIINPQLISLRNNQINKIARNSLLKEKIKQLEIEKFYEIDYKSNQIDPFIKKIFENLKFETIDEFKTHLLKSKINFEDIKKKLIIEQTWNQLIFDKYNNKIKINMNEIEKQFNNMINNTKKEKSYLLHEIVFLEKDQKKFETKYNEILSSINDIGFKKSASIFSEANSSNDSGKIGWIKSSQLNEVVLENIINLEKGQFSKPIITAGGALILFIDDIKEMDVQKIDKQAEISRMVKSEKDRQFNEFSLLHYKKIENNSYVQEF